MPEIPDLNLYLAALRARVQGQVLQGIRLPDPFLLRSVAPPPGEMSGRSVISLRRIGKQLIMELDEERWAEIERVDREGGRPYSLPELSWQSEYDRPELEEYLEIKNRQP